MKKTKAKPTNLENLQEFTDSSALPCFGNITGSIKCQSCVLQAPCTDEVTKVNQAYNGEHKTLAGVHFDDIEFQKRLNDFCLTIKSKFSDKEGEPKYRLSLFVKKIAEFKDIAEDLAQQWVETYVLELKHPDLKPYINFDIPKFELKTLKDVENESN